MGLFGLSFSVAPPMPTNWHCPACKEKLSSDDEEVVFSPGIGRDAFFHRCFARSGELIRLTSRKYRDLAEEYEERLAKLAEGR